jgi:hypothetical protein
VDVDQVHNQAAKDFSDEVELMQYMRPNRWLAVRPLPKLHAPRIICGPRPPPVAT